MKTKQYKAKNVAIQLKPPIEWLLSVAHGDNDEGFCLACGETQSGIEPDAGKCHCDSCGAPKVYGAEQLILMNLYFEG